MPFEAYRDKAKTILVKANETYLSDAGKTFYCKTKNCKVEYGIVNPGSEEDAFFRRKPTSLHHICAQCARNSMVFHEQQYDESQFSSSRMFGYILHNPGEPTHAGGTGTKRGHVGGRTGLRTLRTFYELVCNKGINSLYNGVLLSELYANDENYSLYRDKLEGNRIIEASFYCLADPETLLFNYQSDWTTDHIIIAMQFPGNHQKCIEYFEVFSKHSHTEPIILCGNWTCWGLHDYIGGKIEVNVAYRCDYISSRQIFDPN